MKYAKVPYKTETVAKAMVTIFNREFDVPFKLSKSKGEIFVIPANADAVKALKAKDNDSGKDVFVSEKTKAAAKAAQAEVKAKVAVKGVAVKAVAKKVAKAGKVSIKKNKIVKADIVGLVAAAS